MSAMRDKDQADWDLERCFEMFDQALISRDERVVNALRNLLMVVTLTAPETELSGIDSRKGPLRRMIEDQKDLIHRLIDVEADLRQLRSTVMATVKAPEPNWPYLGGSGTNGGGYGGGLPGVTDVGKFHTTAHEAHEAYIRNKIRGLKDDEC